MNVCSFVLHVNEAKYSRLRFVWMQKKNSTSHRNLFAMIYTAIVVHCAVVYYSLFGQRNETKREKLFESNVLQRNVTHTQHIHEFTRANAKTKICCRVVRRQLGNGEWAMPWNVYRNQNRNFFFGKCKMFHCKCDWTHTVHCVVCSGLHSIVHAQTRQR